MSPAFPGLRVLDLSTGIAGAYCTKLLTDAGAAVDKLEPPSGDPLRRFTASGTELPAGEDGALFQYLAAGKRSIALDARSADDRERILALAAGADLVVEDLGPGAMEDAGLGLAASYRNGVQAFAMFESLLGYDNLDSYAITLGVRGQF